MVLGKRETMNRTIGSLSEIANYTNWILYQVIAQELLNKIQLINTILSSGILENSEDAGDFDKIQHELTQYREYLYRLVNREQEQ